MSQVTVPARAGQDHADQRGARPGPAGPGGLADTAGGPVSLRWLAPFPLDVMTTLGAHRRGRGDPAFTVGPDGAVWRTSLTPDGPATLRVTAAPSPGQGTTVHAATWGPGAWWLLSRVPGALGARDDPAGFDPSHAALLRVWRAHAGMRVGRTERVMEALVPAVLEQKVVGIEACRSWRRLLLRYGSPAPGPAPAGMRVFPPPRTWARIPSWEWHRAGAEAAAAATIIAAARVAGRLEEIVSMPAQEADRRLRSLPGIGPWTSAEVRQRACGDADAVSVGDYHLPAAVGWLLARRTVDDAGMLELLAPYAGHRHRVARLVELSGVRPPRRGPRLAPRDYRSF